MNIDQKKPCDLLLDFLLKTRIALDGEVNLVRKARRRQKDAVFSTSSPSVEKIIPLKSLRLFNFSFILCNKGTVKL